METVLLLVCFLLIGAMASNVGLLPAQVYWNTVLPNTPMPAALSDVLSSGTNTGVSKTWCGIHNEFRTKNLAAIPKLLSQQLHDNPQDDFFLERDLYAGSQMKFPFTKRDSSAKFLPKTEADSIPFSSNKLPQIINRFSVQPGSLEEVAIKYTLTECEAPAEMGQKKMCATSLESMVDFSVTNLGTTNLKVVSTTVHSKTETSMQEYTIVPSGVKQLAQDDLVACHQQPYPYAVFYCHMVKSTKVYTVKMTGKDGTVINTVAVCHTDTSEWNPKHVAFQVLNVKPGTVPVCHFLCEGNFVFTRNNYI